MWESNITLLHHLPAPLASIHEFDAKEQEQRECGGNVTLYGHCLTCFKFSLVQALSRDIQRVNFIVHICTSCESLSDFTFLSIGQQEINRLVRKLRTAFPFRNRRKENKKNKRQVSRSETENMDSHTDEKIDVDEEEMELDMQKAIQNARRAKKKRKGEVTLPDINLDNYSVIPGDDTEVDLLGQDGVDDIESDDDQLHVRGLAACQPMWVLPLYSLLPSNKQALVSICSVVLLTLHFLLYDIYIYIYIYIYIWKLRQCSQYGD